MANTTTTTIVSLMDSTKFRIDTQHFSPHDLALFVDSIETISRLIREREDRKKLMENNNNVNDKVGTLTRKKALFFLGDSFEDSPAYEDIEEREEYDYDETYFSAPNSAETSPFHGVIERNPSFMHIYDPLLHSNVTTSDSEESGVFPIATSQSDIYEPQQQTVATIPRSKLITKDRSQSTKSRLLRMVSKKETEKVPSVQLISCRHLDEYESLHIYQRQKQQASLKQENNNSPRFSNLSFKLKIKQRFNSRDGSAAVQERFVEKARRYLTL